MNKIKFEQNFEKNEMIFFLTFWASENNRINVYWNGGKITKRQHLQTCFEWIFSVQNKQTNDRVKYYCNNSGQNRRNNPRRNWKKTKNLRSKFRNKVQRKIFRSIKSLLMPKWLKWLKCPCPDLVYDFVYD